MKMGHINNKATRASFTPVDESANPDPESCSDSEAQVNARLRQLRREQGFSIRSLATKCGISANTLSLIENERTSPSLRTLQLLARGLGVPLATFFEEEKPKHAIIYQQADQRPTLLFPNGAIEKLSGNLPPLGAEPILVTIDPDHGDEIDISHAGREFIFCLAGGIICGIDSQEFQLSPGDSLLFDANAPHRWWNAGITPSKLLVLFCPMESRDQPAERHLGIPPTHMA